MFESKHEKKVNECYPQGAGEQGPVAGKISSLTYYINAKPAKLLKVAAYLERKAPRDLTKQSAEHNAVTLDIVRGIMANCGEYFVSFAPTVLRILMLFTESPLAAALKRPLNEMVPYSASDGLRDWSLTHTTLGAVCRVLQDGQGRAPVDPRRRVF